jgi:prepilin-type N-terminal cleavage/methylation domain-containing protein
MYYIHNNKQINSSRRLTLASGFTLIELLLVVAMLGLVAIFSLSLSTNFLWRTDLNSALSSTVANLRYAQILAQTETDDTDWGVHLEDNQLILFQGNDFINRDILKDEEYDLGSVSVSTPVDVIYQKFSGYPYENLSEINLTTNEDTVTLTVNKEGTIDY